MRSNCAVASLSLQVTERLKHHKQYNKEWVQPHEVLMQCKLLPTDMLSKW